MKTPDNYEQQIHRWLDGEMHGPERVAFESEMQQNPGMRAEVDAMQRLGSMLRSSVTMERAVPNADFFNSQIQERISEIQREEDRAQDRAGGASWLNWLRAPWAIAAGAVALLALSVIVFNREGPEAETVIISHYAPNPNVQVKAFHSVEADATVLLLDGLDAIPASKDVAGLKVHSSSTDAEVATTTLFDQQGRVLLVMTKDAASRPQFVR